MFNVTRSHEQQYDVLFIYNENCSNTKIIFHLPYVAGSRADKKGKSNKSVNEWCLPEQWASSQIRKIAGCACAGNAGNVFPPWVSDPNMHHGTCVAHVLWCMPGSQTTGFLWSQWRGNVPGIPGACATCNFTYLVRGPWISRHQCHFWSVCGEPRLLKCPWSSTDTTQFSWKKSSRDDTIVICISKATYVRREKLPCWLEM